MENIVITEEQFEERFTMLDNHFYENPNDCSFNGCLFETYGEEREYVNRVVLDPVKKRHLWTIVEGDSGDKLYYQSGYHIINRLGFFFTSEPVTEDHLTVVIDITPDV
jgi:hypothetical protein